MIDSMSRTHQSEKDMKMYCERLSNENEKKDAKISSLIKEMNVLRSTLMSREVNLICDIHISVYQ